MAKEQSDMGWMWSNLTPQRKTVFTVGVISGFIVSVGMAFIQPIGMLLFFVFLLFAWMGAVTSIVRRLASAKETPQKD